VKSSYRIALTVTVALAGLFTAFRAVAQLPTDPAERAKVLAQIMQANARQITLFDREGKQLAAVGARDLYAQPVFSPDARRVAVIRQDPEKENTDLWVVDLASGNRVRITEGGTRETTQSPAWAPDGSRVAYVGLRQGAYSLYQKLSNGQGNEELLYKSNATLVLTDWSMDGRYLTFYSTDLGGGAIFALPMTGTGERKPIEIFRSKSQLTGPRLSPNDRFVAYVSNETGRTELYIRPFDPNAAPGATPSAGPWKISEQGAQGMAFWRRDGREINFLGPDRSIVSVAVTTIGEFEFGKPATLFRVPESTPVAPNTASVNRDADRFVIAVPPPQLRQLTFVDRSGKPTGTIGEPGRYGVVSKDRSSIGPEQHLGSGYCVGEGDGSHQRHAAPEFARVVGRWKTHRLFDVRQHVLYGLSKTSRRYRHSRTTVPLHAGGWNRIDRLVAGLEIPDILNGRAAHDSCDESGEAARA
jgi:dipeptidyl aminopeptidase/acylaminoacyl peptidase